MDEGSQTHACPAKDAARAVRVADDAVRAVAAAKAADDAVKVAGGGVKAADVAPAAAGVAPARADAARARVDVARARVDVARAKAARAVADHRPARERYGFRRSGPPSEIPISPAGYATERRTDLKTASLIRPPDHVAQRARERYRYRFLRSA